MNDKLRKLIKAIAENDIKLAKQIAMLIIDNDKTEANKAFCNRIRNIIQSSSMNLIELPYEIRNFLYLEDVSVSFNERRYFLSDREKIVAGEVLEMYETSQKLSEMGIQYLNSLMLYGESGTGKTLFGRYLAYILNLPFAYMNFSNAISSYLGSTAKNINKSFEYIEKQRCVFMIDEVDAIGMARGKEDVGEMARVTISLMQSLDCLKNDTVIIGATNRLDMIDPAILRRFAISHNVCKFSVQEMFYMIIRFLQDVGIKYKEDDIKHYCKTQNNQSQVINDVVRAIAKSIRNNIDFKLSEG